MALIDITSDVLTDHSHIQIEEWHKQGSALTFDSGKSQRIVGGSMGALEMTITYNNVTQSRFETLRDKYENNYAQTFILKAGSDIDWRDDQLVDSSNVWAFQEFEFSIGVNTKYIGTIKFITSVFFDFPEYQSIFTQSNSYTPVISTDTSFTTLNAVPYHVRYEYINNSIFSNIGQSVRHIKDKTLRKKWQLSWLLEQADFLELLMFYRKRGGIMSAFGMPELGHGTTSKTEAIFMQDSFKYDKRLDGLYACQADIVEVL
jgi:hypothetical protein